MKRSTILVSLLLQCGFLQVVLSAPWLPPCPLECWCHEAPLASVWDPLPEEMQQGSVLTTEGPSINPNDVLVATTIKKKPRGKISTTPPVVDAGMLKTAICVQQKNTDVDNLIARIPPQTQAIRIIQAPDAGTVSLDARHFRQFSELQALILEGSMRSHDGEFTLNVLPDALKQLENLRFLTMKGVALSLNANPAVPEKQDLLEEKEIFIKEKEEVVVEFRTAANLSFVVPDDEIVSYEVYKMQQKTETDSEQQWDGFSKLQKLRKLHIFHSQVPESFTRPDSHTFADLPSLHELVIEHCDLKSLIGWSRSAPNLKILSLAGNEILSIDADFLDGVKYLEYLDLSNNNVTHVTELSFPNLEKLAYLNLEANPLETVFPRGFSNLGNLRTLHLGNEGSYKLRLYPDSFSGLSRLEQLWATADFSNLVETETMGSLLRDLKSLRELHLRGNLSYVGADSFVNLKKLTLLDLQNCNIQKLSVDSFQGLERLQVLDLSFNSLNLLLPGVFDSLTGLRELWLNNNMLVSLPRDAFAGLPAKLIRLENNPWHCDCRLDQLSATSVNKIRVQPSKQHEKPGYAYERKVSPTCATPEKYKSWSIFDVMRKELRCKKRKAFNKKKLMLDTNLTRDPWSRKDEKEFDIAVETTFEFFEDPDVIEHGPEAADNEETTESLRTAAESEDEYDDHGPEATDEDTTTTRSPSTSSASLSSSVLFVNKTTPSNNNERNELAPLLKAVQDNPFYSEKLSKKSLKLLMEEEKTKNKDLRKIPKKTIDNNDLFA